MSQLAADDGLQSANYIFSGNRVANLIKLHAAWGHIAASRVLSPVSAPVPLVFSWPRHTGQATY